MFSGTKIVHSTKRKSINTRSSKAKRFKKVQYAANKSTADKDTVSEASTSAETAATVEDSNPLTTLLHVAESTLATSLTALPSDSVTDTHNLSHTTDTEGVTQQQTIVTQKSTVEPETQAHSSPNAGDDTIVRHSSTDTDSLNDRPRLIARYRLKHGTHEDGDIQTVDNETQTNNIQTHTIQTQTSVTIEDTMCAEAQPHTQLDAPTSANVVVLHNLLRLTMAFSNHVVSTPEFAQRSSRDLDSGIPIPVAQLHSLLLNAITNIRASSAARRGASATATVTSETSASNTTNTTQTTTASPQVPTSTQQLPQSHKDDDVIYVETQPPQESTSIMQKLRAQPSGRPYSGELSSEHYTVSVEKFNDFIASRVTHVHDLLISEITAYRNYVQRAEQRTTSVHEINSKIQHHLHFLRAQNANTNLVFAPALASLRASSSYEESAWLVKRYCSAMTCVDHMTLANVGYILANLDVIGTKHVIRMIHDYFNNGSTSIDIDIRQSLKKRNSIDNVLEHDVQVHDAVLSMSKSCTITELQQHIEEIYGFTKQEVYDRRYLLFLSAITEFSHANNLYIVSCMTHSPNFTSFGLLFSQDYVIQLLCTHHKLITDAQFMLIMNTIFIAPRAFTSKIATLSAFSSQRQRGNLSLGIQMQALTGFSVNETGLPRIEEKSALILRKKYVSGIMESLSAMKTTAIEKVYIQRAYNELHKCNLQLIHCIQTYDINTENERRNQLLEYLYTYNAAINIIQKHTSVNHNLEQMPAQNSLYFTFHRAILTATETTMLQSFRRVHRSLQYVATQVTEMLLHMVCVCTQHTSIDIVNVHIGSIIDQFLDVFLGASYAIFELAQQSSIYDLCDKQFIHARIQKRSERGVQEPTDLWNHVHTAATLEATLKGVDEIRASETCNICRYYGNDCSTHVEDECLRTKCICLAVSILAQQLNGNHVSIDDSQQGIIAHILEQEEVTVPSALACMIATHTTATAMPTQITSLDELVCAYTYALQHACTYSTT